MASHLPAPDAPIPDVDPSATVTHDDLLDPFFATLHELLRPASPVIPSAASVPDANPSAPVPNNDPTPSPDANAPAPGPAPDADPPTTPVPAPPSAYAPTISTAHSRPATYNLPPSPRRARSSSPTPSSSFSHYSPRDPDESYIVFPHEPWKPLRGDGVGFAVGPPITPLAFQSEANETIPPTASASSTDGTPTTSPTPPTSTDETPPTTPPNLTSPTPPEPPPDPALRRPIGPSRARPIPVAQPPANEVYERDPEVIALAVKKTMARMKTEHRALWRRWVAFRDRGKMEKVFVMRKRGKWFDEGHRSVWREIEKRGVCSALWKLPPAPPLPGTLPPSGESLVHPARARYLTALNAHKAWRRTLRCCEPAVLNTYEDEWYPHFLLLARIELLDANPHREEEQDEFRRVDEHFALLHFEFVKGMRAKDAFRYEVNKRGRWRYKGVAEQVKDMELANGEVPDDMSYVREEDARQEVREKKEWSGRKRRWQSRRDSEECAQEFWGWCNLNAWACTGRWDMPVLRYGRGTMNTAEVPVFVDAVSKVASVWEDDYPAVPIDGHAQAETLPAVPQEMDPLAAPFVPLIPAGDAAVPGEMDALAAPFDTTNDDVVSEDMDALAEPVVQADHVAVPEEMDALAEPFVLGVYAAVPQEMDALAEPFAPLDHATVPEEMDALPKPFVSASHAHVAMPKEMDAFAEPFIPADHAAAPLGMVAALAEPFSPTGDAAEGSSSSLSPLAQEWTLPSGNGDGVVERIDSPAQPVAEQPRNGADPQVRAQSPQEEFLQRCNRRGVVVTSPRIESPAQPAVQEVAPFSDRLWYEEFMDLFPVTALRIRRIPRRMAPWR